jgi:pimeloyl-ACP methyl ester carboxylesterase
MEYAHIGDVTLALERHPPSEAARSAAAGVSGLPVLLIMGFTMPGRAWRLVLPHLGPREACTFDNRGAGDSGAPAGPYTMAMMAGDARGVLAHLGWPRAHVVGVSMGGMIAQHLALSAPERVASLSLIATHAGGLRQLLPPVAGLRPFVEANAFASLGDSLTRLSPGLRGPLGRQRFGALSRLLFGADYLRSNDPETLAALLRHDFEPPAPAAGRKGQLAAAVGHRAEGRLAQLAGIPTLVVKAPEDRLIDPRHSDALAAAIPGAHLVSLDGAGHGLVRQVPERLGGLLAGHFAVAER